MNKIWSKLVDKNKKLGMGTLGIPDEIGLYVSRNLFFNELKIMVPELLEDLKKCLPVYSSIIEIIDQERWKDYPENFFLEDFPIIFNAGYIKNDNRFFPMLNAFVDWAYPRNLYVFWFLEIATNTLKLWHTNSDMLKKLEWAEFIPSQMKLSLFRTKQGGKFETKTEEGLYLFFVQMAFNKLDLEIPIANYHAKDLLLIPTFNPLLQTKADHKKLVDEIINQYQDGIINLYEKEGAMPLSTKKTHEDFKWLIHYQVQGWSYQKIAEYYNIAEGRKTVTDGVKRVAELIDLTLRPPLKAGRPKA